MEDHKEIKKWKTISSRYIIKRPWLTARCDELEMPNGVRNPEFYVLEYPTWINVVARTRDGNYVLVEQYRHGLDMVLTELCAGTAEAGELPEEAARRELLEETGYGGGEWQLVAVLSANPTSMNNLAYCYFATDVERLSDQHLDTTEDIAVVLYTRDELIAMLERDELKQSLMAAPLWKLIAKGII